jgi:asparagine synthetase B (glutamine-hydrolysing)
MSWDYNNDPVLKNNELKYDNYFGNIFNKSVPASGLNNIAGSFLYIEYNKKKHKFEFAVDHTGYEQIFFYYNTDIFIISDKYFEIVSELVRLNIQITIAKQNLIELLIYRANSGENTLIEGIYRSHFSFIYLIGRDKKLYREKYWNFNFQSELLISEPEILYDYNKLFSEIIESYGIEDKNSIASMTGGGLDSCFLQTHLNEKYGENLYSFSSIYNSEKEYDDTDYALSAAKYLKNDHHIFNINKEDYIELLPEIIDKNNYPLDLYHTVPFCSLFDKISPDKIHIFTGWSADLIWGEGSRKYWSANSLAGFRFIINIFNKLPSRLYPGDYGHYIDNYSKYYLLTKSLEDAINYIPELYLPIPIDTLRTLFGEDINGLWDYKIEYIKETQPKNFIDVLYALGFFQANSTMSVWHQIAKRAGKKIYFPYYDRRMLEFVKDIKPELRFKYWGFKDKILLRKLAMQKLPREVTSRPKRVGELPVKKWMLDGEFDMYLKKSSINEFGVDTGKLIHYSKIGQGFMHFLYWNIINFEIWYNKIVEIKQKVTNV